MSAGYADEVGRLYSLGLDEFIAERDAAAKRAREDGDRDAAKRIKALRKPSVPAAAINRAVRADESAAEGLIAAGERLEAAQSEALAGGDADTLREAIAAHSEAVEALMETVARELDGAGGSAAIDRARETLRAAAGDEELRGELAAGTLVRDREGVGFGGAAAVGEVTRRPTRKRTEATRESEAKDAAPAKRPERKGPTAAERKRAQAAVRRAERSLESAAKRLKDAERRLERARRGVAEAEEEREDAAREQGEREAELAEARDHPHL